MTFVCNQNWDNMVSTTNGRHCGLCKKEVIDFTTKTKQEIDAVKLLQNQNLCGRFLLEADPDLIAPISAPGQLKFLAYISSLLLAFYTKPGFSQTAEKPQPELVENTGNINNSIIIKKDIEKENGNSSEGTIDPGSLPATTKKKFYWTKKFPFIRRTYSRNYKTTGMGNLRFL